jgi:GPI mannosyltransferase 3
VESRPGRPSGDAIKQPPLRRRLGPGVIAGGGVFLIAFAARLLPVLWLPGINHPDEVFQSVEQAHRLVYGIGIVPWEFDYGVRSWLMPGVAAGLMEAARLVGDGPDYYLPLIGMAFAALSAGAVLCVYLWGRRLFGIAGGIAAAVVPGVWIDCVYFGPRTLSEVVAAHLLVIATYLVTPDFHAPSRQRLVIGGALFGLILPIRLQLLPAVALIMVWSAVRAPRWRALAMSVGLIATLALSGALDAATWGYPFESTWRNFTFNLDYGVSAEFGIAPWSYYLEIVANYWGLAGLVLLALAGIGVWRLPMPLAAAGMILVSHSLIAHKEFRFIYPAILLVMISAGIGLGQLVVWIGTAARGGSTARRLAPIVTTGTAAAGVVLLSVGVARSDHYDVLLHRGSEMVRASRMVAHLTDICGIGTFGFSWTQTGGYAYFHQPLRFYWPNTAIRYTTLITGFNTLIYRQPLPRGLEAFTTLQCFGDTCVAHRAGVCLPVPIIEPGPRPAALNRLTSHAHLPSTGDEARPIVFVDLPQVLRDSNANKEIVAVLNQEFQNYSEEVARQKDDLGRTRSELERQRPALPRNAFEALQQRDQQLDALLQTERQALQRAYNAAMLKVETAAINIIAVIAQERGTDLLLTKEEAVPLSDDAEITADVVARLNKTLSSVPIEIPRAAKTDPAKPPTENEGAPSKSSNQ